MGRFIIFGICAAFLSFPALAAGPVSTEVAAGTTTYKVTGTTVRTPSGVALSSARDITPYIEKLPNRGLSQTANGRLIVAELEASTSMFGRFNVSGASVVNGAKTVLRATPVVATGALGLQALLDSANWVFGDHGELLKPAGGGDPTDPSYWGSAPEGVTYNSMNITGTTNMMEALQDNVTNSSYSQGRDGTLVGAVNQSPNCLEELRNQCSIKPLAIDSEGRPVSGAYYRNVTVVNPTGSISCSSGSYDPARFGCVGESQGDFEPVTEAEIDAEVESNYEPDPTDWPSLFPYIEPDTFTVTSIPELELEPMVSTSVDELTGSTTTTETQTKVDFSTSSNDSAQPSISSQKSTSKKTYKDGALTSSTVVTDNSPARPSDSIPPSDSSLPVFCEWVPDYVCSFFSWAQEPFDEPEPDLSGILIDEDFEREKNFSFGSKTCPADILVPVPFLSKQIAISYAPFCDLASLAYYMVMMSAYVFAAYISIGVSRG